MLEYRGEIVTVPAKNGQPRNLTNSVASHDRGPAWSPDGQRIAWFSEVDGEYALRIRPQAGTAPAKVIPLNGGGFYFDLKWSPDGEWVSYRDNTLSIFVLRLKQGRPIKVASEPVYGPVITTHHSWSPDSKWLAYTTMTEGLVPTLHLYSVAKGSSFAVTDGLIDATEPVFDKNGKMLYFIATHDGGGIRDWFSQWVFDFSIEQALYAVTLDPEVPSPVAPKATK